MEMIPAHFLQAEKPKCRSGREMTRKRGADQELFISGVVGGGVWGEAGGDSGHVMEVTKQLEEDVLVFQMVLQTLPVTGWLMGCERPEAVWTVCPPPPPLFSGPAPHHHPTVSATRTDG